VGLEVSGVVIRIIDDNPFNEWDVLAALEAAGFGFVGSVKLVDDDGNPIEEDA